MKKITRMQNILLLASVLCASAQATTTPYYDLQTEDIVMPAIIVNEPAAQPATNKPRYYAARFHCDWLTRSCAVVNLDRICNGFSPDHTVCAELR